ncbi:hypothetical protein ACA910_001423 [Epithemia clementina (nom. ined.)]
MAMMRQVLRQQQLRFLSGSMVPAALTTTTTSSSPLAWSLSSLTNTTCPMRSWNNNSLCARWSSTTTTDDDGSSASSSKKGRDPNRVGLPELVDAVVAEHNGKTVTKKSMLSIIRTLTKEITKSLVEDKKVFWSQLGKFEVRVRKAGEFTNVQNPKGEKIFSPESKIVKFQSSATMKKYVKGQASMDDYEIKKPRKSRKKAAVAEEGEK